MNMSLKMSEHEWAERVKGRASMYGSNREERIERKRVGRGERYLSIYSTRRKSQTAARNSSGILSFLTREMSTV